MFNSLLFLLADNGENSYVKFPLKSPIMDGDLARLDIMIHPKSLKMLADCATGNIQDLLNLHALLQTFLNCNT